MQDASEPRSLCVSPLQLHSRCDTQKVGGHGVCGQTRTRRERKAVLVEKFLAEQEQKGDRYQEIHAGLWCQADRSLGLLMKHVVPLMVVLIFAAAKVELRFECVSKFFAEQVPSRVALLQGEW